MEAAKFEQKDISDGPIKVSVPCKFCGKAIEFIAYIAKSGKWIGAICCSNCRYRWISHGETYNEVLSSLEQGGDDGSTFVLQEGIQVMWVFERCGKEYIHGGIVLANLAPGVDPDEVLWLCEEKDVKNWQKHFRKWGSKEGDKNLSHFRRYLVKQERKDGRVLKRKPLYYAPRASTVERYMARMANVGLVPAIQQLSIGGEDVEPGEE